MTSAAALRSFAVRHGVTVALALAATFVVYRVAWISDDAIITFRYVWNFLHGYGAVFNVGERVQGYTHALWFVLLAAATLVTRDEVFAASALSLGLTFGAVTWLGASLAARAPHRAAAWLVTALVVTVFAASDSWRAFQTSGLEGALSTFLLIGFVFAVVDERPERAWRALFIGSLLAFTRPDFAIIVTPVSAVLLVTAARDGRLRRASLGLLPLSGFIVIRAYYGELLPNTGAAKLGIFTFSQGVHQGLSYLVDWARNEPVTTLLSFALLALAFVRGRGAPSRALCAGLLGYGVYLVVIGGDFMRGRLFMPLFVGNCAAGAVVLVEMGPREWRARAVAAGVGGVLGIGVAATLLAPVQTAELYEGILNERVYYWPRQSLASYYATRRLARNEDFDRLEAYLKACGSVTIDAQAPGALGYYLGPQLTVIDRLGLTDRFIAHLPRSALRQSPPRPGHPYKHIPLTYLQGRGCVTLLPSWKDAMHQLDCSMTERLKSLTIDPTEAP